MFQVFFLFSLGYFVENRSPCFSYAFGVYILCPFLNWVLDFVFVFMVRKGCNSTQVLAKCFWVCLVGVENGKLGIGGLKIVNL